MKASEFKAWLDGYLEGMDGVPEQAGKIIERIREQVAKLEDGPELVYRPPIPPNPVPPYRWQEPTWWAKAHDAGSPLPPPTTFTT